MRWRRFRSTHTVRPPLPPPECAVNYKRVDGRRREWMSSSPCKGTGQGDPPSFLFIEMPREEIERKGFFFLLFHVCSA